MIRLIKNRIATFRRSRRERRMRLNAEWRQFIDSIIPDKPHPTGNRSTGAGPMNGVREQLIRLVVTRGYLTLRDSRDFSTAELQMLANEILRRD